jgi:transposase InsO family protein
LTKRTQALHRPRDLQQPATTDHRRPIATSRSRSGLTNIGASNERSHRIDSQEFYRLLKGQIIDDTRLFTDKLQEWEDYYNYHRPHGALNGQTPYERLRQKTQDPLS